MKIKKKHFKIKTIKMKKLPLSLDISVQFFQGSKTTQKY